MSAHAAPAPRKLSAYAIRKRLARLEGEVKLWTAIDPALHAEKLAELKAEIAELIR